MDRLIQGMARLANRYSLKINERQDMEMKKKEGSKLTAIAYSGLVISILSAFTTIVGYTNSSGTHRSFSLVDLLSDAEGFGSFVFDEYMGKAYAQYQPWQIFALIALGTAAIACAFVGLKRLSKQTDNRTSFVLTIIGLVGTMAPSVIIFICIVSLKGNYMGTISCGIYPVMSPVAMVICIFAVTRMRRRNIEYRKKLKEAEGLIFKGGDL